MLRAGNRPLLAYFDSIKNLRIRQLNLILKAGYDPNLLINARGQNGLQFMVDLFNATDAHFRLQAPINKAAYMSIAKLLLDSGLDPNTADLLTGDSVIYEAIRMNDREMVNLLLHYADLTHRNKNGETILMCAARFGSKQTMRLILEHLKTLDMDGYFLRQRNRFGLTSLELARAENLECAKVLTKHLISFGHHTGSVLSRSSSYHQLRALQNYRPVAPKVPAANLLDDSASDYSDSDLLAPTVYNQSQIGSLQVPRNSITRAMLTGYKTGSGIYDPKAAEFNQYLLEQQQELAGESSQQHQQQLAGTLDSDQDDYFGLGGAGGGQLTRSRSCMLGPSSTNNANSYASNRGSKYCGGNNSSKSKNVAEQTASLSKQNWDGNSAGGRNPPAMG